jgi:hypothetical protein
VTRIAHLTDLHLNGGAERRGRFERGLLQANSCGANYLLLTGDLTAHGNPAHFTELAGCLERRWPYGVTIVGGNHDGAAFHRALGGPLRAFAESSAGPVDLGDSLIIPVATYYHRRGLVFRALGRIGDAQLSSLESIFKTSTKPVVVAMHHGPQTDPVHAFAGLVDGRHLIALLEAHSHVSVCCGHDHRVLDLGRVHAAASVAHHPDPLRLYDVTPTGLSMVYSGSGGEYFG